MQDNLARQYEFNIEDAVIEEDSNTVLRAVPETKPETEFESKPESDINDNPALEVRRNTHNVKMRGVLRRVSTIAMIVSIIAIGGLVAIRYASATEMNYKNRRLQREYDRLQVEIEDIKAQIESEMSITDIAKIATERLGMQKPESYQIVYIDAENQDQTVVYSYSEETNEEIIKPGFVHAIKHFLGIE